MARLSQNDQVLSHLKSHVGITTLTAFEKYGISRLSARIHNLREMGYDIASVPKTVKNRYGEKCHVVEYRLVRE